MGVRMDTGSRIEKSFLPVFSFYRAANGGGKSWPSNQVEHGWIFCAPQWCDSKIC
jgi:hypothetical protein